MRLRASSSSNIAACAGAMASCAATTSNRTMGATATPRRPPGTLLAGVDDVVASILGPGRLVVTRVLRFLLAEAHGLDLRVGRAVEQHHALDGVSAALAERDVVFPAAALVGVALDRHARRAGGLQILRVRLDQRLVFVLDRVAVIVEVHAALGEHVARI